MTLPGKICVAGTVVLCQRSPAKKSNYNNSDCLKFYSTADCRLHQVTSSHVSTPPFPRINWQGRRSKSTAQLCCATTCSSVWPHTTTTTTHHHHHHINSTWLFLSPLWSDLSMWGHFFIVLNLSNPNLRSAHKNFMRQCALRHNKEMFSISAPSCLIWESLKSAFK